MSLQDDSRLIQEVRKYGNIYDPRSPNFKDVNERENTWHKIGYKLGLKPQDAKGRWQTLRDRFVREKKRLLTDGEAVYKRDPWSLLDDMSFLWDFITHRQKRRPKLIKKVKQLDVSKQRAETEAKCVPPILPHPSSEWVRVAWEYGTPTASPLQGGTSLPNEQSCIIIDESKIKRENSTPIEEPAYDEPEAPIKSKCSVLDQSLLTRSMHQDDSSEEMPHPSLAPEPRIQHFTAPTRDEDELFCLSVAGTLKRFSAKKKALAKLWIQQVLYEVEFQSSSSSSTHNLDMQESGYQSSS